MKKIASPWTGVVALGALAAGGWLYQEQSRETREMEQAKQQRIDKEKTVTRIQALEALQEKVKEEAKNEREKRVHLEKELETVRSQLHTMAIAQQKHQLDFGEKNIQHMMETVSPWVLEITGKNGPSGTGFVIENNIIVTNAHVIANCEFPGYSGKIPPGIFGAMLTSMKEPYYQMQFSHGNARMKDKKFLGRVLKLPNGQPAVWPQYDVAFMQLPQYLGLPPSPLKLKAPNMAAPVAVFGNPEIQGYVTYGRVSKEHHQVNTVTEGFMVDAAINPGNSGGPIAQSENVMDAQGNIVPQTWVVGMSTYRQILNANNYWSGRETAIPKPGMAGGIGADHIRYLLTVEAGVHCMQPSDVDNFENANPAAITVSRKQMKTAKKP